MTHEPPSSPPDDLAALLQLWPSYQALAEAMGEPYYTVRWWVVRGRIPPRHWPRFIAVMQEQHGVTVTADHLAAPYQGTSREVA